MRTFTQFTNFVRITGIVATAVAIAGLAAANQANAQSLGGDDGIAASPKVRAQMNDRQAGSYITAPAEPSMACPKCTDEWVSVPNVPVKGAQVLAGTSTRLVARHLCTGCDTTVKVEGLSKQTRHEVVSHKCTGCGAENLACCGQKESNVATKGMQPQPQVAPLK